MVSDNNIAVYSLKTGVKVMPTAATFPPRGTNQMTSERSNPAQSQEPAQDNAPKRPYAKVKYLDQQVEDTIFEGKPETFEFFTSEMQGRVFGQIQQMDKYALFVGTSQAQNELSNSKVKVGIQLFRAQDLRDFAEMLMELATYIDRK